MNHRKNIFKNKTIPTAILSLFFFPVFTACGEPGSYISVDGNKLTKEDLLKDRKKEYVRLYNKFQEDTYRLLQDLAVEKMLEKEAKSNDQKVEDYIASIRAKAPVPGEEEIGAAYRFFKEQGYVSGSLEESRSRVLATLMRQSEQQAVSQELERLKEKYNMETYVHEIKMPVERVEVSIENEPSRGPEDAKLTIVEFSDFECPFCKRAQSTTKQIQEKYGNKVRWVFKDFPLDFHQNAMGAHLAANCVYRQDPSAYWSFFDDVFQNAPASLKRGALNNHAKKTGINMGDFQSCMDDPAMKQEIQKDIQEGQSHGVNGTPAFFINGRMIEGAVPYADFEKVIEEELSKK